MKDGPVKPTRYAMFEAAVTSMNGDGEGAEAELPPALSPPSQADTPTPKANANNVTRTRIPPGFAFFGIVIFS
jgi:hypothetical protein